MASPGERGLSATTAVEVYLHEIGHVIGWDASKRPVVDLRSEEYADLFSMTMADIQRGEERVRLAFTKKA